jgi:Mg2+ and Co2+ transporter CorA
VTIVISSFAHFSKVLNLPPLVIDLCSLQHLSGKAIDVERDLTIQIPAIIGHNNDSEVCFQIVNLVINLTDKFCLTFSRAPKEHIEKILEESRKNIKFVQTPGFMVFLIMEFTINKYIDVLRHYETIADNLDIQIHEQQNVTHETDHGHKKTSRYSHMACLSGDG